MTNEEYIEHEVQIRLLDKRFDILNQNILAMNQRFDKLEAKIDAVGARLDAKIDGVEAKLEAKIDKLDAKIESYRHHSDIHFYWMIGLIITTALIPNIQNLIGLFR